MKLTYYKGEIPNFGDELNTYIWPQLLGSDFFDDNSQELFIGIGSILYDWYPRSTRKIVVGSGYGGYTPPPDVHDGSWDIVFVRGPRTAKILKIGADKAVCDGAILLTQISLPPLDRKHPVSFMPHYDSLARGFWPEACRLANINFINPAWPVERVLSEIQMSRMIVCEAMHGAIVADILRTPWIAATPIHTSHRAKWLDWADSLHIRLRSHSLFPSSIREVWTSASGAEGKGVKSQTLGGHIATPVNLLLQCLAAHRLHKMARQEPQLSNDHVLANTAERAWALTRKLALG